MARGVGVRISMFHFVVVACLLHTSLGQQPELLVAFDNMNDNEVTLECQDQGIPRPATFTFRNPMTGDKSTADSQRSHIFTIRPGNETIVSCRVMGDSEAEDSDRIMITGMYAS